MKNAFRIFFGEPEARPTLVLACLTASILLELVSFGAFFPLLTLGSNRNLDELPELGQIAMTVVTAVGLSSNQTELLIFIVVALLLKNIGLFLAMTYAGAVRAHVVTRIRHQLLLSTFVARWAYLIDREPGRFANEVSHNAQRAGDAYIAAAGLWAYLIQGFFYLVGAMLVSAPMTLAGLVAGLLIAFSLGRLVTLSRIAGQKFTSTTSDFVSEISDVLNNIKPIKAMHRQSQLVSHLRSRIEALKTIIRKEEMYRYALDRGAETLLTLTIGIGFYVAAIQLKFELSELIVIAIFAIKGADTLRTIQNRLLSIAELESAYFSSGKEIQNLARNRETSSGRVLAAMHVGARFENVSFAYDDNFVIKNASFTIPAGEITLFLGQSGSGKTSIVDLLLGLHQPTSGQILIDDVPIHDISIFQWRRMIGYVPQELTLLHGTIRDNITLGDNAIDDKAVYAALHMAGADRFVLSLPAKIDTDIGEMGARLSGGERQRIAIARAVVAEPRILILDEVTSALDPDTEATICENIAALRGRYTFVVITHRPAWKAVADRQFVVSEGKVTEIPCWPEKTAKSRPNL